MANSTDKLSRLAELEWMRAEIVARRLAQRAILTSIAALIGFLALAALSFGFFLILAVPVGEAFAALIVGGVLAALAAIIIALVMRTPGRTAELESQLLDRSITDARNDLREGFGGGGSSNLATIITVLTALSALSPTLASYIQPILKIIR
tara:strand:+ start:10037 stop:10489 length:453 start_codon:yes stop_codon:yes gene_type:complete